MDVSSYIGLDVGTSCCKAAVIDEEGSILATARREYRLHYPEKGAVELDPDEVWNGVKEVIREVASGRMGCRMLAVSSIGEAMVLLDRQDRVVRNAITYLDERGEETVEIIKAKIDQTYIEQTTGLPLRFFYSLNKYIWLCGREPDSIRNTDKYFLFGDYITYMFSGARMIDVSSASKTFMLNIMKRNWDPAICHTFDVPLEKFSKVVQAGTVAGRIRKGLAKELGLSEELEIVVGCHDQCAATLGSGCVEPGDMAASEGSTESLNLVIGTDDITESLLEKKVCIEPYVIPGCFIIPAGQHTHGTSIKWFVNGHRQEYLSRSNSPDKSLYEVADEISKEEAGTLFFVPHLTNANLMDPDDHSLGAYIGIDVSTDTDQMYQALLEGICFETRVCFDAINGTGLPIKKIMASGGCSKSGRLMQLKSDVMKNPISVLDNKDTGLVALAMICAVADGRFRDFHEAKEHFVKSSKGYKPNRDYDKKYEQYRKVCASLKSLYEKM